MCPATPRGAWGFGAMHDNLRTDLDRCLDRIAISRQDRPQGPHACFRMRIPEDRAGILRRMLSRADRDVALRRQASRLLRSMQTLWIGMPGYLRMPVHFSRLSAASSF